MYKVSEEGKEGLVESYTAREILQVGDVELFVKKKLVPTYGPGHYVAVYVRGNNEEVRRQGVFVQPPVEAPARNDQSAMIDRLMNEISELRAQAARPQMAMDPLALTLYKLESKIEALSNAPAPMQFMPPPPPENPWTPEKVLSIGASVVALLTPLLKPIFDGRRQEISRLEKEINEMKQGPEDPVSVALESLDRFDQFAQKRLARLDPERASNMDPGGLPQLAKSIENTVVALASLQGKRQAPPQRVQARVQPAPAPKAPEAPKEIAAPVAETAPAPEAPPEVDPTEVNEGRIEALCDAIENGADMLTRGPAVLDLVRYLFDHSDDKGKKQIRRAFKMAHKGDKAIVVKFLRETLEGVREAGFLSQPAIDAVCEDFDQNFELALPFIPKDL